MAQARRAFTLIELLVVISIIAILAAILFPVFAQAKVQAKQTVSVSNLRQLDIATQLYVNDADDTLFNACWFGAPGQTVPDNYGGFRWPWVVRAYAGNAGVFSSPLDTIDLNLAAECGGLCRSPQNPYYGYLWGIFPSYGLNWFYLTPDPTWHAGEDPRLANPYNGIGIAMSAAQHPSTTILYADSTYGDPNQPTVVGMGYWLVNPPMLWTGEPPLTRTSYGFVWPRSANHAATCYLDGHVASVPIGALAGDAIWNTN